MTQPRRCELISALRRAEERLREIGSDWEAGRSSWVGQHDGPRYRAGTPGWVRFETLEVANDLLRLLMRIDASERRLKALRRLTG